MKSAVIGERVKRKRVCLGEEKCIFWPTEMLLIFHSSEEEDRIEGRWKHNPGKKKEVWFKYTLAPADIIILLKEI